MNSKLQANSRDFLNKIFPHLPNHLPDALIVTDIQDKVMLWNPAAERLYGWQSNEVVGKTLKECIQLDGGQNNIDLGSEATGSWSGPVTRMRKDSTRISVWTSISVLKDDEGDRIGTLYIERHLSDCSRAVTVPNEEDIRWRALIENSTEGIAMLAMDGTILYESPSVLRLSGYLPEELKGRNVFENLHPEDQARATRLLGQLLQEEGTSVTAQFRVSHKDHTWRWIETTSTNLLKDPSVKAIVLNYRDITDQKRTEIEQVVSLEIMQGLAFSTDLDDFLRLVHVALGRVLKADNFFVALYDAAKEVFEEVYVVDQYDEPMPPSKREKTLTSYIFRTREPLLCMKACFEQLLASGEVELIGEDSLSFLGVPLIVYGKVIGVMAVQDYEHADTYAERDLQFMMTIAGQIALSVQRRQADEELRQSEERFRSLYENATIGMYRTTPDGQILLANPALLKMLGYASLKELVQRNLELEGYEPGYERTIFRQKIEREGEIRGLESSWKRKDGSTIFVRESAKTIKDADGQLLYYEGTVEDITERKQAEEALRESEKRLELFIEHAPAALAMFDPQMCYLAASRRWLSDYQLQGRTVIGHSHYEIFPNISEQWKSVHRRGLAGEVVRSEEDKFIMENGLVQWQRWEVRPWYAAEGSVGGIVIFTEDITERVLAEETLNRRVNELTALYQTTLDIISVHDLSNLLNMIVARAVALLNGTSGGLYLCDPQKRQARCVVSYNTLEDYTGTVLAYGEGAAGTVAATGKPLMIDDYRTWEGRAKAYDGNQLFSAVISAPMLWQGQVTGVIHVLDNMTQHTFTDEDLTLLTSFANQAAIAVENAHLLDDAQRRLKHLSTLRQIEQVITNSLDLRVTLNILLTHVLQQLEVDAATVLLYQPELQNLKFIAGLGFRTQALQSTNLRLGDGFAGQAALEQRIIHISDLHQMQNGFTRSPEFTNEGFINYVGVPLITKGKVTGVLEIYNRRPLDQYPEWLEFLEALAGQAAIAIDNIRLFEDLQASNLQLLQAYDATITGWSQALALRDRRMEGSAQWAVDMTLELAHRMGIPDNQLAHIRWGALLHDIGKMGVPDAILQKPGPLSAAEWEVIRQHPVYAYQWLSPILYLRPSIDIPYYHHEKWDGTGYPRGLKGEGIPLAARIFAVVHVWDALTSDRPYRLAWSKEKALAYIKEQSGHAFDPAVVHAFLQAITSNGTIAPGAVFRDASES